MSAWHHNGTTGLHWPSEKLTQHSEVFLPVHFLLSAGCDDTKLLSYSSHWVIGSDTPIYLWEREKDTNTDEDKMTVKAPEQCFTFSYIYTAKGNWLHPGQKQRVSGAQCWEKLIVLHSSALERQMCSINGRLPSASHRDARVEVLLNYRVVFFLLATA